MALKFTEIGYYRKIITYYEKIKLFIKKETKLRLIHNI